MQVAIVRFGDTHCTSEESGVFPDVANDPLGVGKMTPCADAEKIAINRQNDTGEHKVKD